MVIVIVSDTSGRKAGFLRAAFDLEKSLSAAGLEVRTVISARAGSSELRRAMDGADIVHLMSPSRLEKAAEKIAREAQIPVLASFPADGKKILRLAASGTRRRSGAACAWLESGYYFRFTNILCHAESIRGTMQRQAFGQKFHVVAEDMFGTPEGAAKIADIYAKTIADDRRMYAANTYPAFKRNWAIMPPSIDFKNPYKMRGPAYRAWSVFCYWFVVTTAAVISTIFFGLRTRGRKNLWSVKGGAITVSNHIHNVDGPFVACALLPSRISFTSIEGNFRLPVVRWIISWLGVVPIPTSTHLLADFFRLTVEALKNGRKIHFYPEGSLLQYCETLRPFKRGAFRMAAEAGVPVIPVVLVQRPCRGIRRLFRRKPLFTSVICEPVWPDPSLTGTGRTDDLQNRVSGIMRSVLEKSSASPDPESFPRPEAEPESQS